MNRSDKDVVCLGNTVLDVVFDVDAFPEGAEKFHARNMHTTVGGPAANAAIAIMRLGGSARLVSRLGDDQIADAIISDLEGAEVDRAWVLQHSGHRSSCSAVYIDPAGERQIVNYRDSSLPSGPEQIDPALARPFAAALADVAWPEGTRKLMQAAKQDGRPGIIDFEIPRQPDEFPDASHLAFSAQGLREVSGIDNPDRALQEVAGVTDAFVCVTLGEEGAKYVLDGDIRTCPGYRVKAVETLGAGDVWHGAFALCLGRGLPETQALDYANAAAALRCSASGDWRQIMRHNKVVELMNNSA